MSAANTKMDSNLTGKMFFIVADQSRKVRAFGLVVFVFRFQKYVKVILLWIRGVIHEKSKLW